jgi:TetR/AcrR family transcriptional regulator
MPKIDHDTKERILAAAEKVFHANGFKGTRTVQIAEVSGISRTMLHYYFRTKEDLFQAVINKTMANVFSMTTKLVTEKKDFETVIHNVIETLADVLESNPGLPSFIVNIMNESPEIAMFMAQGQNDELPSLLDKLMTTPKRKKLIRKEVRGEDLIMNIYALLSAPYLAKPYVQAKEKRDDASMNKFIKERRRSVKEFVLGGIRV